MDKHRKAANLIRESKNILVLTGAGMSTESGVKDFRSSDGLNKSKYKGYETEEILSIRFFNKRPKIFYDYLEENLNVEGVVPNRGHNILASLEKDKNITIITQNVDELHQEAGSTDVVELHGNLRNTTCNRCFKNKKISQVFKEGYECECGGIYKPDVVLYGEDVPAMEDAVNATENADLLIVLGTSLMVYPAASIPRTFGVPFKPAIIINKEETILSGTENVIEFNSGIGKTLGKIMSEY